jgi:hypothetical protein
MIFSHLKRYKKAITAGVALHKSTHLLRVASRCLLDGWNPAQRTLFRQNLTKAKRCVDRLRGLNHVRWVREFTDAESSAYINCRSELEQALEELAEACETCGS